MASIHVFKVSVASILNRYLLVLGRMFAISSHHTPAHYISKTTCFIFQTMDTTVFTGLVPGILAAVITASGAIVAALIMARATRDTAMARAP